MKWDRKGRLGQGRFGGITISSASLVLTLGLAGCASMDDTNYEACRELGNAVTEMTQSLSQTKLITRPEDARQDIRKATAVTEKYREDIPRAHNALLALLAAIPDDVHNATPEQAALLNAAAADMEGALGELDQFCPGW